VYSAAFGQARSLGAEQIATIAWPANTDGLGFAKARGHLLPRASIAYETLRLRGSAD
jgi:hypothetical protein